MQVPLLRLSCGCNSYDWGKVGASSAAAKFAAATHLDIQEDKPYAELWMGTHPSLPSKDVETQRSLLDMVNDNQALMSPEITSKYGGKLPFLFKVLSIRKALSIQAHPNKKLAEKLHAKDPKNYPDDNHKPEMAIAVTPFDGLCGFRPLAEIAHFLKNVLSLRSLVGEENAKEFERVVSSEETSDSQKQISANREVLRKAFSAIMSSDKVRLQEAAKQLLTAAKTEGDNFAGGGGPSNGGKELADLILRLNDQFEGDIGLFVVFFVNYVKLEVGEALFLRADDIHAYLSGDIIECMASSDNVVRAGFTPKYKDIDTLTTMLTYNYAPISEQKMSPPAYPYVTLNAAAYSSNSSCLLYDPPIEEFAVLKTELKSATAKATFEPLAGPSILICTDGGGTISVGSKTERVETGYVYFVGATAEVVLESNTDNFTTFRAFCELSHSSNGST